MIVFPSVTALPNARLYRDSANANLVYVDLLEPASVRGEEAARWLPMPEKTAYLVGEVRFGPGEAGFGAIPERLPGQRLLPMPWEIGPVFAWCREGEGARLVARGKTSGFGASNAVLSGTAPVAAMASPLAIAAELTCPARLSEVEVRLSGDGRAVQKALEALVPPVGGWAWDTVLAEALEEMLRDMVKQGALVMEIRMAEPRAADLEEITSLAYLEWAHRTAAKLPGEPSLAQPVALVKSFKPSSPPPMDAHWRPGDRVGLRAVRALRPGQKPESGTY